MNTIEGNKLIADFMSRSYQFDYDLKYHSSFDWLMPVVEKIELLGYYTQISRNEDLNSCYIFIGTPSYKRREEDIVCYTDFKYDKKIESVYEAVIQFIEWYNKEQSVKESDTSKAK